MKSRRKYDLTTEERKRKQAANECLLCSQPRMGKRRGLCKEHYNEHRMTSEVAERKRKREAGECMLCSQPRWSKTSLCRRHYKEREATWNATPRKKIPKITAAFRSMQQRAPGDVTLDDLQWLLNNVHSCRYCGDVLSADVGEFDHITPIGLGGRSDGTNIQYICKRCNRAKGDDLETDFMAWLYRIPS